MIYILRTNLAVLIYFVFNAITKLNVFKYSFQGVNLKTFLWSLHYTSLPSLAELSIPNNCPFTVLLMFLQAKTIGEFVSKFADLQTELETLIQAQRYVAC